jgi:hypothetical protein
VVVLLIENATEKFRVPDGQGYSLGACWLWRLKPVPSVVGGRPLELRKRAGVEKPVELRAAGRRSGGSPSPSPIQAPGGLYGCRTSSRRTAKKSWRSKPKSPSRAVFALCWRHDRYSSNSCRSLQRRSWHKCRSCDYRHSRPTLSDARIGCSSSMCDPSHTWKPFPQIQLMTDFNANGRQGVCEGGRTHPEENSLQGSRRSTALPLTSEIHGGSFHAT